MSDVFISYAREDREFARRLVAGLGERRREVWVDWEDIRPSDEWWKSIVEAIDAADAVLFVLSPDSVASKVCRRELAHAASQQKRVIGVVGRDVEGLDIPDTVSRVDWVFLRAQDDWRAGLDRLEEALDLNIDLIRLHTRVLTRAEAWRLSGRRASPLLRGEELREAQRWVAEAATGGEPRPTALQSAFVEASRHAAQRRQRQAISGSAAVAVVAIALSIFALIQRAQARHQASVAESRQLAADAVADLASDPEQAVALAARGARIDPTLQSVHALWEALTASRLRATLVAQSPVTAVAFSPDGAELAVGSADGTVRVWSVAARHVLFAAGHGGAPVAELGFDRSGSRLVVTRDPNFAGECSVTVYAAAGAAARTVATQGGVCRLSAVFVAPADTVAVAGANGYLAFFNASTGAPAGTPGSALPVSQRPLATLVASADGQRLAIVAVHSIRVIDVITGHTIARLATSSSGSFNPNTAAFSPDDNELLVSGEYGTEIYYLLAGTSQDLYAQDGSTISAAWAGDGRVLAAAAGYVGIDVWSSSSRLVESLQASSPQPFRAVAMTATGLLAGGSSDGSVRIWAADPDLPDRTSPVSATIALGLDQAVTAPGAHLALLGDASHGVVLADDSGRVLRTLHPGGDGPIAGTANRRLVFTRQGRVIEWQLPAGTPISSRALGATAAPAALAASEDGATVATISRQGVITVLSGTGVRTTRVSEPGAANPDAPAPYLSISPDGRLLAAGTASGVVILATANLRVVRTEAGGAVAFSPTGTLLAIQRPDQSIALLSTAGWAPRAVATGDVAPTTSSSPLSFSPDGRLLAAVGTDGRLRVWDTRDGSLIASRQLIESSLQGQRTGSPPVALTAAGTAVVGSGATSAVAAFDVCRRCFDVRSLLSRAAARLRQDAPVSAG